MECEDGAAFQVTMAMLGLCRKSLAFHTLYIEMHVLTKQSIGCWINTEGTVRQTGREYPEYT